MTLLTRLAQNVALDERLAHATANKGTVKSAPSACSMAASKTKLKTTYYFLVIKTTNQAGPQEKFVWFVIPPFFSLQ